MQIRNHALDRLIAYEQYVELLVTLTPKQLCVAALLLDGLHQSEVSELLDLTRSSVESRLTVAQQRILHTRPELASWAAGRRRVAHYHRCRGRPLGRPRREGR